VLGCCFVTDSDQLSEFEFGVLDTETREFSGYATIDGVEDPFGLWSVYIGETDASVGEDALMLSGAPGPPTWLVGDGASVWIVRADGNVDRLALPWSDAG
jgi:hypothetical protein